MAQVEASSVLRFWSASSALRQGWQVAALVTALTVTLLAPQPASANAAGSAPTQKDAVAKVASRPDVVSARVTARAQGARVEVDSLRNETSTTWVNPDGTLTTRQHAGQIRYRDSHGQWRDVDLNLEEAGDGTVAPKGHPRGLSLAGGKGAVGATTSPTGTDAISVREKPGRSGQARDVVFSWPATLGAPELSGTKATYKDALPGLPGVDLVVESRRTGFESLLVIRTPQALAALQARAGDAPVVWELPVRTRGLTARAEKDGRVSFVDSDGKVASQLAAPWAWDAAVDQLSGDHKNVSPVSVSVRQQGKGKASVTLTPDQKWLASPDRVFPVTIDPTYASGSLTPSFDTYVSSAFPSATYSTSTELRVGTYNAGGDKYRSFLNFPIGSVADKDIVSASLSLYEFHSYSCTAKPFYVWSAAASASSTTNWSNQPAASTQYGSLSAAKGYSTSCAAGRVSVPVTGLVQAYAASSSTTASIRLHASESDSYGWKKFYSLESSQDPYITYTYNRKPNAAAAPTMEAAYTPSYVDPRDNLTYLFTSDSTPRFYSKATDPDASPVAITFEVHSSTAGTTATKVASCGTGNGASGALLSCAVTTALPNNAYHWVRAAVRDDRNVWNGTWSPWTKFGTAYNGPPAATVSCPGYANGSWTDNAPTAALTCTVKATGISNDWSTPGYLDLTVDGVVKPRLKVTPTNDPSVVATTVSFPQTANGAHSITATTVARTGKAGTPTVYSFGWGGASLTLPTAGTASFGKIAVTAAGPPRGSSTTVAGKVQWRVTGSGNETTGWTDGPSVTVTAPNATTPVSTAGSFALASAIREAGASADLNARVPVLLDVQVCFTYSGVSTPQCTWSQSPRSVTRVPHAFGGGYPVSDAGPGQVALFTGEFNTSVTDVSVPGYSGDLALSRSHSSFEGDGTVASWPSDPVTGIFGPGWTASLEGPDAGAADLQVVDNTRQDGTIVLIDDEGNPLVYQNPDKTRAYKTGAHYLPVTSDTIDAAADLTISGAVGASMTMTLKEADGTVTTWSPVAYSATADTDWKPVSVNEPGQVGKTSYGHDSASRVTRIVAPVPPNAANPPAAAITCPTTGTLVKGCRALDLTYATATTATSTTPGDFTGRLKQVTATLWDPEASGGAAMATTVVAVYAYDSSGRLVTATDPRTNLGASYTWDGASTRLSSVKPTGLAAYQLSYDTTPATPRVATVTRDNPAGSGAAVTLARYNYATPLSGTGLPDLTSDTATDPVRAWRQNSDPVTGYAVFGADYTGAVSGAGVDWSRADLQYADDQGYTVNAATYGAGAWQITATDYDTKGNVTRTLDAGATTAVLDALGADPLEPGQVDSLSTQTFYNGDIKDSAGAVVTPAGTLVTDTYGPVRNAALSSDLDGDGATDVLPVRPHTKTTYDQNAPTANVVNGVSLNPANNEPWRLPTTIATGVAASTAVPGEADLEITATTVNSYDKLSATDAGEGNPWELGAPAKVTTGGIAHATRYDTEGRVTEVRQPLSNGADAGTTKTVRYTAGANTADAACGNKVEWSGLVCRTFPAAAPSAGASGASTLPGSRTTAYNAWLQPRTVEETSGAVTRTTTTKYDSAGRTTHTWTTVAGLTGSTARPGTFTHYRTADGLVDYTGDLNTAKTDADLTARTTTTFDQWGRALTLTNDLGDVTTTTYVAPGTPGAGQIATVTDAKGATTFTYDGTDAEGTVERRGLPTGQTVTRAGAAGGSGTLNFSAAYNAEGNLVTQKLPGQVTQRISYDEAGEPVALSYSGTVQPVKLRLDAEGDPEADPNGDPVYDPDGAPLADQAWLTWSVVNDTQGRIRTETTGPSAGFDGNPGVADPAHITPYDVGAAVGYDRRYTYDAAGRLTIVADHTADAHGTDLEASPCVNRTYGFDGNGRRTALTSAAHSDGNCAGATGVTTTTTGSNHYDTADRPTLGQGGTGQYVYDALGRQTTVPAVDAPNPAAGNLTLGYFDDDLPRAVAQGDTATTFTLDSAGRRSTATTTVTTGTTTATWSLVRHYADSSDNPAWTDKDGTVTRYAESISGDLGTAIAADGSAELTLVNLHGDTVTTVPIAATAATGDAAPGIDTWSDYTEYGTPRDPGATSAVAGPAGYGWLGGKQRSTSADTAGLTLMGDRLYNRTTGRFTSLDPEPGGNDNAYTYPNDPINMVDLDGHFGWRKFWKRAATVTGFVAVGACVLATAGLCGVATAVAIGASAGWNIYQKTRGTRSERNRSWLRYGVNFGIDYVARKFRPVRAFRYKWHVPRHSSAYAPRHRAATRSLSWGWQNRRRHTVMWTAVNAYYGHRSYKNGW